MSRMNQIFINSKYNSYSVDSAVSVFSLGLFDASVHLEGEMLFSATLSANYVNAPVEDYIISVKLSSEFEETLPIIHPSSDGFNFSFAPGDELYNKLITAAKGNESVGFSASGVTVSHTENWDGEGGNILSFDELKLINQM